MTLVAFCTFYSSFNNASLCVYGDGVHDKTMIIEARAVEETPFGLGQAGLKSNHQPERALLMCYQC